MQEILVRTNITNKCKRKEYLEGLKAVAILRLY